MRVQIEYYNQVAPAGMLQLTAQLSRPWQVALEMLRTDSDAVASFFEQKFMFCDIFCGGIG